MIGNNVARLSARGVRMAATTRTKNLQAMKRMAAGTAMQRSISMSATRMHGKHDHDNEKDFVPIGKNVKAPIVHSSLDHSHDHSHDQSHDHSHDHHHDHDHSDDESGDDDDEDLADMVDTVAVGPSGTEYGGPQRGGQFKEPTRFGDWERKGRCSDF